MSQAMSALNSGRGPALSGVVHLVSGAFGLNPRLTMSEWLLSKLTSRCKGLIRVITTSKMCFHGEGSLCRSA